MAKISEDTISKLIRSEISGQDAVELCDELIRTTPQRHAEAVEERQERTRDFYERVGESEFCNNLVHDLDVAFRCASKTCRHEERSRKEESAQPSDEGNTQSDARQDLRNS